MKECHEIKPIVQELKAGRDDKKCHENWSYGVQAELGKYEKVVEELEELEQKLREQKARETQEKGEKPKFEIKKYPNL